MFHFQLIILFLLFFHFIYTAVKSEKNKYHEIEKKEKKALQTKTALEVATCNLFGEQKKNCKRKQTLKCARTKVLSEEIISQKAQQN